MKQFLRFLMAVCLLFAIAFPLVACTTSDVIEDIRQNAKTLNAPGGVRIEGDSLCWNPVEHASRYIVSVDGKEYYCDDYVYPLSNIADGTHTFKVKAIGDGTLYLSSAFSDPCTATLESGALSTNDYYGRFDDLTKNESFLGYGFDVIRSAVFSDKYVKTEFRIFDTDELMKQRLVKVDSKMSAIDEVKSSSMDNFLADWNAGANVKVEWGKNKKKIGGSVRLKAVYSGGVENAQSKYFHCISIYNQKFYLVLQSDMNTYKSILSEGFLNDLYSDMEPAVLFDRYGTHFITSAIMGGKINSYYLYTSTEEKSYHDISGKVSAEVRYLVGKTKADVSAGYKQYASENNIDIVNNLEIIGGDDFGILSDADIGVNYQAWEQSLNRKASLIGIKNTSSLVPIWELIDASKDTQIYTYTYTYDGVQETREGTRAQQLQDYFIAYGTDSYNALMEAADLPVLHTPETITNSKINNLPSGNDRDEFELFAGTTNDITFSVNPADAIGYTKSASIAADCAWAHIENKNGILSLVITSDAPAGEVIDVILSAGSARKIISILIHKKYTVNFISNGGSDVPSIRDIFAGSQIDAPAAPTKEGYIFRGWYTDGDFSDGSLYRFGNQSVTSNLTLYAKWEPITYRITYYDEPDHVWVTDTVAWNTAVRAPKSPKKDGHDFAGWFTDEACTTPFDFATIPTDDLSLWAKWEIRFYTVSFDTNGGSAVDDKTVPYGDKISAPTTVMSGAGFAGWYKDPALTVLFDFSVDIVTENLHLYAKWTRNPVTVHFNCTGGIDVDARIVEYGAMLGSDMPTPIRTGYRFDGWFTDEKNGTRIYPTDAITASMTLYAHWSPLSYTVSFDTCGGTGGIGNRTCVFGAEYGVLPDAVRFGYVFLGWFTEKEGGQKIHADSLLSIASDHALYAHWETIVYRISYEVNGGTANAAWPRSYTIESLPVIDDPVYAEYAEYNRFLGWYEDADFTIPFLAESLTDDLRSLRLYAKWDLCTIVRSIDDVPSEISGRVLFDWREEQDTDLLHHTGRAVGNAGYGTLEIGHGVTEVIFIGRPEQTFVNLSIRLCGFSAQQSVTLRLCDFSLDAGGDYAIGADNDNRILLTLVATGSCRIAAQSGAGILLSDAKISFIGDGNLEVSAGNGADGTEVGERGQDGQNGIVAAIVTVEMTGTFSVNGGNGGNGQYGFGYDPAQYGSQKRHGGNGGDGGRGGDAVCVSGSFTVENAFKVILRAGKGGDGGQGGAGGGSNDEGTASAGDGGAGGAGGQGGYALKAGIVTSAIKSKFAVLFYSGDGGHGGNGGQGGHGKDDNYRDNGGNGGAGGSGGNAGLCLSADSFFPQGDIGLYVGCGGDGGNGGNGGNAYHDNRRTPRSGNGGNGGKGGDCVAWNVLENEAALVIRSESSKAGNGGNGGNAGAGNANQSGIGGQGGSSGFCRGNANTGANGSGRTGGQGGIGDKLKTVSSGPVLL